jgi:hypothetical protein
MTRGASFVPRAGSDVGGCGVGVAGIGVAGIGVGLAGAVAGAAGAAAGATAASGAYVQLGDVPADEQAARINTVAEPRATSLVRFILDRFIGILNFGYDPMFGLRPSDDEGEDGPIARGVNTPIG